jgi:xylulokinase
VATVRSRSAAWLGVDLGTGGARALLVDEEGRALGSHAAGYPLLAPAPGFAEQEPAQWRRAATEAVRGALDRARERGIAPADVRAIGLTGQMHSLVFLDERGAPLRPAILWCDNRTTRECEELERAAGGRRALLAATLNLALPGFSAPKLLWLRRHEPQLAARVRGLLLAKDWLRFEWSGERVTDVADASGTLLFDVSRRSWSEPMLRALDVDRAWLPRVVESGEPAGALAPAAARELGLPAGTPIVGGAGDQAASAVGSGVVEPGAWSISLGTSGVVFAACERPLVDPEGALHSFCHAAPGRWHGMGVMLSAGGAVSWFRKLVSGGGEPVPWAALDAEAAAVAPGSDGLLFLPYLAGERTPILDPTARGAFHGLELGHGRGHAMRAVMEGVALGLRACGELLSSRGLDAREIRLTGGGARSDVFARIVADALGRELVRLEQEEGPAFGAALLAAAGTTKASIADFCRRWVKVRDRVAPDPAAAARLAELAPRQRRLYESLRPLAPP